MTATAGPRNGRVRVIVVDDEPALTDVLDGMLPAGGAAHDRRLVPMIHTVRGLGYAIRPAEDGR